MHYKSYDIHNKLVQAETSTLRHKNAPHKGDRYCIVLYNKNLNYSNGDDCTRSSNIKKQEPTFTHMLPVFDTLPIQAYRNELLHVLNATNFPKDRCSALSKTPAHSKYGTNTAHFISLGITASRKSQKERAEQGILTRKSVNMNNIKYPKLYYAFCQYINELHPNIFGENAMYHACIIAKNSQCEWHVDKYNIGHASLTCVGDYTGGQLMVEEKDGYTICIPTYNRVDVFRKKTYKTMIQRYNLHDHVMLLLQNDEDEKAYTEAFPELGFMRTPAGLLQTVNYVAGCFPKGHRIVMMHDDITRLLHVDSQCKRHTVVDGDAFIKSVFAKMKQEGCHLGGVYPCNYPLTMAKQPEYTTDLRFIHDPLTFMINIKPILTLKLQFKSDFERTILHYKHDGKVLRMNHYTISTYYNPKTGGGIGHRDAKAEKEAVDVFLTMYGEYVKTVRTHKDGSTSMILHQNK